MSVDLAGDKMRITERDGVTEIVFDDVGTGRACGACQLCCRLVPVPTLRKPAGTRCKHQKHGKGCTIYPDRPMACRTWACRWLADPEAHGLRRPDRCHYVVDIVTDFIEVQDEPDGLQHKVGVIQVWIDPAYRNAYHAPELRAYMARMAEQYRVATIVRFSSHEAMVLFPPALSADGLWHEVWDGQIVPRTTEEQAILDGFGTRT